MTQRDEVLDEVFRRLGDNASTKLACNLSPPLSRQAVEKWARVPRRHLYRVAEITGIPAEHLISGKMPSDEQWDEPESVAYVCPLCDYRNLLVARKPPEIAFCPYCRGPLAAQPLENNGSEHR